MAKKKSGGTSIGLILTLVFFVLTTFAAGTLAYYGYNEQEQFKKEADAAKKAAVQSDQNTKIEKTKVAVLRIALGTDSADDRVQLVTGMLDEEGRAAIKKEHDVLVEKVLPHFPKADDFEWKLVAMDPARVRETKTAADYKETAMQDRDAAPKRTIPTVIKDYKDLAIKARADEQTAKKETKNEKALIAGLTSTRDEAAKQFKKDIDRIQSETAAAQKKINDDYNGFKVMLAGQGDKAAARIAALGNERTALENEKNVLIAQIAEMKKKLEKLDQQSAQQPALGPDLLAQDDKKGNVVQVVDQGAAGKYIVIDIGSSHKLKPGVTFAVLPGNAVWRTLEEKERQIKGQIEVFEVTGPDRAKARIVDMKDAIRDPIARQDQLFNLSWNPNEQFRIAFAGIIDLDGDGLDNNEDFLRLLEKQGVIVDEYLKMKPLENVKRDQRGMSLQTKFLVIAPDPRLEAVVGGGMNDPREVQMKAVIEKMSEMRARARELGIQLIEARKFLAMIGVKAPANPAPPAYAAGVYLDQTPAPMEPKKE